MTQTFVLVATGQAVANLPPVLESALPGDRTVWVESRRAREKQWSAGARAVLARHGLDAGPDILVEEVNDPAEVVVACRAAAGTLGDGRPLVVANGGNKLTPVGLLFGLRDRNPVVLYGEEQPAVYWRFTDGFAAPPVIAPYTRHTMDLTDVLEAGGHAMMNPGEAERLWPGPLPVHLRARRYGADPAYTAQLHRDHFDRARAERSGDWPTYPEVQKMAGDLLRQWKVDLPIIPFRESRDMKRENVFGPVYRSTLDLARAAAVRRDTRHLPEPVERLGSALETAVSVRVHGWLEAHRPAAVQSAWRNVKVGLPADGRVTAEFDVLLVLRNGILLHLECKSAEVGLKDLHARIWNLQQASSRLARMAVCMPSYPTWGGEEWARQLETAAGNIGSGRGLDVVRFTLPNHFRSACPSFEQALESLLKPYQTPLRGAERNL